MNKKYKQYRQLNSILRSIINFLIIGLFSYILISAIIGISYIIGVIAFFVIGLAIALFLTTYIILLIS
jgi:uncharacterized membrane protein YuzA (DUF378 family)